MIDQALIFLRDELNAYILLRTNSQDLEVNLSGIVTSKGLYAFPDDSLALTIYNLEEDHIFKSQLPEYSLVDGQHVKREPELKLLLHVLFAANFGEYEAACKAISLVLGFFQSHPVFLSEEYPGLPEEIGKLTIELESQGVAELSQIWSYLGAPYLPSVTYRIRLVVIQNEFPSAIQRPIQTIKTNIHSK